LNMHEATQNRLKPIRWYRTLADREGRVSAQAFLVEGERAIHQIIDSSPATVLEILSPRHPPLFCQGYRWRQLTDSQLKSISSTQTPQPIIALVKLPVDVYSNKLPDETGSKILLLEDVQDPGNVGSIIRSAAAFRFSGIIMTDKCADPFSPKCVQSTAGTLLSLWIRRTADYLLLVKELEIKGYPVAATVLQGTDSPFILKDLDRVILALGNEAAGLSPAVFKNARYRIKIPIDQTRAQSLNVAVCGAICMYLSTLGN